MEDPSRPVTGYPATGYANGHPSAHNSYPATGTAYPYAAPPPTQTQGNYYYGTPYSSPRATFLRRFLAVLIGCIIITGTVVFIVWIVLRPRIPEFRVDSVALSNFNVSPSSSLVSGDWDVRFTVRNPNHKLRLYYDHIAASVYYNTESLSETTVPPFDQGTRNETAVRATFAAASTYLDGRVANDLNQDRARRIVNFNVRMIARVRFKTGSWRARRRFLRVYCGDLTVGTTSNSSGGTMTGGSKQCRVAL